MEETAVVANIRVVNLASIVSGDIIECDKLLLACREDGFFYLDYTGQEAVDCQSSLELIKEFYNQDLHTKMRYWRGRDKPGYKPLGIDPGILKDDLIARSDVLPPQVLDHSELFERFVLMAHEVGLDIMKSLSRSLKLEGFARFEEKNRTPESSKSAMEYLKYAKQSMCDQNIGHKAHTTVVHKQAEPS
ncbi:hypothetical protein CC86DRAFT_409041 [Ophiobolus disseminans]|uniref:Non-haem dioxygenase N-terminal domain-containing protein n=1 Tax=Ophiobolus disseminans TaxID=1469910 RepID=A0A6A6ZTU7_9PLEO|nr:hypothetical protein CC86DRAFT_409041 [Ophiobolus disseminans]